MKSIKFILAASFVISSMTTTGCVSSGPYVQNYDANKSVALNVVDSTMINRYNKLKDTEVPVGVKKHIANTAEFGVVNSLVRFNYPAAGVSSLAAGGLGILEMLAAPTEHTQKINLVGWLPTNEASSHKEARDVFLKQMAIAVKMGLNSKGLEIKADNIISNKNVAVYTVSFEGMEGCDSKIKDKSCLVGIRVTMPVDGLFVSPFSENELTETSYLFRTENEHKLHSTIFITLAGKEVKNPEILQAISKFSPKWSAIYVPPMTKKDTVGTKYPYVLKEGNFQLFIK